MEPVKWALQALDIIESETRDLVPAGAPSPPKSETDVEIAPLVPQVGASSIAEIEKMIGELQEAKDFLQSEGERVQRETEQYTTLTQMASASVKPNSRSRPSRPRTAPVRRACRINHHSPRDKSEPGPEGRTPEACWQASNAATGRG